MQIWEKLTELSKKKHVCAHAILSVSRNTSSEDFEIFSMGASHLDDISKLNATKFAQIGQKIADLRQFPILKNLQNGLKSAFFKY